MVVKEKKAQGVIRLHPRGFGFVSQGGKGPDVFIRKRDLGGAVDGDLVSVRLNPLPAEGKGPDGKVIAVLERGRKFLVGTVAFLEEGRARLLCPLVGPDREVYLLSPPKKLQIGHRAVMEITEWGEGEENIEGQLKKILGTIEDASIDLFATQAEYDLPEAFPAEVEREAYAFGTRVTPEQIKGRRDLRHLETVTIDPTSARDFDDAISLAKEGSTWRLWVHVADVAAYVLPGSALDREAAQRGNSTYFPSGNIPMLPRPLSEGLCSLKPRVNRLAHTVEIEISAESGKILKGEIYRSVIRSDERLTYEQALSILHKKKQSKHRPLLKQLETLCLLLQQERRERGSLEFSLPEIALKIGKDGEPTGTERIEYDITHQMIEQCMLKANEVVATHLSELGRGLTYRVHEPPASSDLAQFAALARAFGFRLSAHPKPSELQLLFDEARATPHGVYLAVAYIRSMKMAFYSPDNVGHYGLGLEHYCHFTSPIRRYADLIVHRTLLEECYPEEEIAALAQACSEKERLSSRAENSHLHLKKLRLLKRLDREDPTRLWKAIITSVRSFGIEFEITDLLLDGFVHISELGNDYYQYDQERSQLVGERGGERLAPGVEIELILLSVDLITRTATWIREQEEGGFSEERKKGKAISPRHGGKKRRKKGRRERG